MQVLPKHCQERNTQSTSRSDEAEELIEKITSEVVDGRGSVSDQTNSGSSNSKPLVQLKAATNHQQPRQLSTVEERLSPDRDRYSFRDRPCSSTGGAVKGVQQKEQHQPDVIASATLKNQGNFVELSSRSRERPKLVRANSTDSTSTCGLSPSMPEKQFHNRTFAIGQSAPAPPIGGGHRKSATIASSTEAEQKVMSVGTVGSAGEKTTEGARLERVLSLDPIADIMIRRMSIQQQQQRQQKDKQSSHRRLSITEEIDRSASVSVAEEDGSNSAGSSFETDRISMLSSTSSRFGRAKDSVLGASRAFSKTMHRFVRGAVSTARQAAGEGLRIPGHKLTGPLCIVSHKLQHGDEGLGESSELDEELVNLKAGCVVRPRYQKKGPFDFEQLRRVQQLTGEHSGAVWRIQFSLCGRLLATAGQDNVIRLWVLKDSYNHFNAIREKYSAQMKKMATLAESMQQVVASVDVDVEQETSSRPRDADDDSWAPFVSKAFCTYRGHTSLVADLSWSKNYFLLSCGLDRTVRLWHVSRTECLCVFQHTDFVMAVAFLPKDDRYFVSGSCDGKLRLWHVPDKKVALWNEERNGRMITVLTFVKNGAFLVVGTSEGRCVFYATHQFKYHTAIDVRSSRGKNSRGRMITGLSVHGDKLLVTSSDSRIRLYDLRDMSLECKYKGLANQNSRIRASFSPNGRHVISGSLDRNIYLWRTSLDTQLVVRKDRNAMWERVSAHSAVVTTAIFAPRPEEIFKQIERLKQKTADASAEAESSISTSKSAAGGSRRRPSAAASTKSSPSSTYSELPLAGPDSSTARRSIRQKLAQLALHPAVVMAASPGVTSTAASSLTSYSGDVIVSSDISGALFVFVNRSRFRTGASTFYRTD